MIAHAQPKFQNHFGRGYHFISMWTLPVEKNGDFYHARLYTPRRATREQTQTALDNFVAALPGAGSRHAGLYGKIIYN